MTKTRDRILVEYDKNKVGSQFLYLFEINKKNAYLHKNGVQTRLSNKKKKKNRQVKDFDAMFKK